VLWLLLNGRDGCFAKAGRLHENQETADGYRHQCWHRVDAYAQYL